MRYLPIGTVVTLVNGTKPIMIYGRKQMQQGNENIWDYVACLYPEGNLGDQYNVFFQHEEIDKVHHYGMESLMSSPAKALYFSRCTCFGYAENAV